MPVQPLSPAAEKFIEAVSEHIKNLKSAEILEEFLRAAFNGDENIAPVVRRILKAELNNARRARCRLCERAQNLSNNS